MSSQGCVYSWCGCREPGSGQRMGARCPLRGEEGHGSWYLSLDLPAGLDGRRRRIRRGGCGGCGICRGGFPSRNSAQTALARLQIPPPGNPDSPALTVGQWLERWLVSRTAPRSSTLRGYAAYHLIALRGLRRGEAAGLRWFDIDLDTGTAIISWQLQQYDGHITLCPPKIAHSERIIALDRTTVAALRAHRARQLAERAATGQDYLDSGYVFTRLNGDPMAPDWLSRYFRQLNDASGLPRIRLHDLRHGAASLAQVSGGRPESRPGHARALQHRAHR